MRPILLNACARAATAEEARFRIDRPIGGRTVLVVALDDEAAVIVGEARRPFVRSAGWSPEELADVDLVVMVGTAAADEHTASAIARACFERGIMTEGLVVGDGPELGPAVAALRPYARNLMATRDQDDVAEVLTALRA